MPSTDGRPVSVDAEPAKRRMRLVRQAAFWSTLVLGGVIYGHGIWWYEEGRKRRR